MEPFNFYNNAKREHFNASFSEYLNSSKDNMFVLDLSNCTIIECIDIIDTFVMRTRVKLY